MTHNELKNMIVEHAEDHGYEDTMRVCILFIKHVAMATGGLDADCGDGVTIEVMVEDSE